MVKFKNNRSESEKLANRVFHFYKTIARRDSNKTWQHFKTEGCPKKPIYNYISKYKDAETVIFKKNPGRTPIIATPQKVKAIKKTFTINPSISNNAAARKVKISKSWLSKIKVHNSNNQNHKLGIRARAKQTAPKYIKDQESRVQKCCKKLYPKMSSKIVIIDDDTYVYADPPETPGMKFFHSANPADVDYQHKVKVKTKFPKKFLVWQAMGSFGHISPPYICEGTINATVYKTECLKRLLRWVKTLHKLDEVLFWPDLATSHYAKVCTTYLSDQGVDFVLKNDNPPNVPQLRPIKEFWALCKRRYSNLHPGSTEIDVFKRRWGKISKDISKECGKSLMAGLRRKIGLVATKGVKQILKHKN